MCRGHLTISKQSYHGDLNLSITHIQLNSQGKYTNILFIQHDFALVFLCIVHINISYSTQNNINVCTHDQNPVACDPNQHVCFLFRVGKDKQRNPHCIKTTETECDLTNELDLKGVYTAEVLSESLRGMTSDHVEPPYTRSKTFCPYNDSECPTMHSQPVYQNIYQKAVVLIILICSCSFNWKT